MTSPVLEQALVGPLRPDARRDELLGRVGRLPPRLQAVLRGSYLEGRPDDELAADCQLTARELVQLRHDALRALGRHRPVREPVRAAPSPYG